LRIKPILNYLTIDNNIDYIYYCGLVYSGSKEYDKAIGIYEYGIKYIMDNIDNKGNKDKELIHIYNNLGFINKLIQDYKKALYYLNKSKELQIELNGEVMQSTMDNIKECLEK
jgi:tetratricopeptide (TPR) repeat protein